MVNLYILLALLIALRVFFWVFPASFFRTRTKPFRIAIFPAILILCVYVVFIGKTIPKDVLDDSFNKLYDTYFPPPTIDPIQNMAGSLQGDSKTYLQKLINHVDSQQYEFAAFANAEHERWKNQYIIYELYGFYTDKRNNFPDIVNVSAMHMYRAYAFRKLDEDTWPDKWKWALGAYNGAEVLTKEYGNPEDSIYYCKHRADTYLESGNYETAILEYNKVIEGNTGFPHLYVDMVNVYYGRGLAHEYLGQTTKAKDDYLQAQEWAYEPIPLLCNSDGIDSARCMFNDIGQFKSMSRDTIAYVRKRSKDCQNIRIPKLVFLPEITLGELDRKNMSFKDWLEKNLNSNLRRKFAPNYREGRLKSPTTGKVSRSRESLILKKIKQENQNRLRAYEKAKKERAECLENQVKFFQALEVEAENRVIQPQSILAYSYFRNGSLYLKQNPRAEDSAAIQFLSLFRLGESDSLKTGAGRELADLLGEVRTTTLLDTLTGTPDSLALPIMIESLEGVRVHEKRSRWWLWLILAIIPYLYLRYKRRKSKPN